MFEYLKLLTGSVFECNIAHRSSVSVLCMMYKIVCNPMHPIYCALPVPYVPVRVARGSMVAHRCTHSCAFSLQNLNSSAVTLFSFQCLCGPILLTMYLMVWDCWVSRARLILFYWPKMQDPFLSSTVFLFLFFLSIGSYCGAVVFRMIRCKSLFHPCTADLF